MFTVDASRYQGFFLGGGFKDFLFSSLFGEDSHFDDHIFQMGWNHQLVFLHPSPFLCCQATSVLVGRSALNARRQEYSYEAEFDAWTLPRCLLGPFEVGIGLSILTPQKCLFWEPGPVVYRFKTFHWRVQGSLGWMYFFRKKTELFNFQNIPQSISWLISDISLIHAMLLMIVTKWFLTTMYAM